jgi:hypothetical protein
MRHFTGGWVAARTTILATYFDTIARKSTPLPDLVREKAQTLMAEESQAGMS